VPGRVVLCLAQGVMASSDTTNVTRDVFANGEHFQHNPLSCIIKRESRNDHCSDE